MKFFHLSDLHIGLKLINRDLREDQVYILDQIVDIAVRTVEHLYKLFPGKKNSKGYRTLDPHIGVVYGDGVTLERAERIYGRLTDRGFAANVISFGAGSFSFNAIEEDGILKPFTRDTFSIAVKATYGEVNGQPIFIFKDPKTDTGHFKKSQKGMCVVYYDHNIHDLAYQDELERFAIEESLKLNSGKSNNLLKPVFRDGHMLKEYTLQEIRDRIYSSKGGF